MVPFGPTESASRGRMPARAGAGDGDDAPACGAQVRQRRVHDVVEAHHLLLEMFAERRRLHPADVDLAHEWAGRVHQRVHPAELRRQPVDCGRGRHCVEQVDASGRGAPTEGLHVDRDGAAASSLLR